jgi:uncharacterized protein YecE (DUF72 family)
MSDKRASIPFVGCAGWSIRLDQASLFPWEGSHLSRYARRFAAVEVNSSFHRPHRAATYERWRTQVPAGFRLSVKAPKEITHEQRLANCAATLDAFLAQISALGHSLGPVLFQLPPSMHYERGLVRRFLTTLRTRFAGEVVFEPRHASWFTRGADALLREHRVARVAADPAIVESASRPGGWPGLVYYRLHGSPVMYSSAYDSARLSSLAADLAESAQTSPTWCIFDNTRFGAAVTDALQVIEQANGAIAAREDV